MTSEIKSRLAAIRSKAPNKSVSKVDAALLQDMNETFGSASGRNVLRHLMRICGYQQTSVTLDPTTRDVQIHAMMHNEARRGLYLEIRSFIREDTLAAVENRQTGRDEDKELEDMLS